jgi:predicted nuclease of predicted toxin-antitoxin system
MKFLVDAHLPPSLCAVLERHGHDANHTLNLPAKNATTDSILNQISLDEQRVVISKDSRLLLFPLGFGPSVEAHLSQDGKYVHSRVVCPFRATFG